MSANIGRPKYPRFLILSWEKAKYKESRILRTSYILKEKNHKRRGEIIGILLPKLF